MQRPGREALGRLPLLDCGLLRVAAAIQGRARRVGQPAHPTAISRVPRLRARRGHFGSTRTNASAECRAWSPVVIRAARPVVPLFAAIQSRHNAGHAPAPVAPRAAKSKGKAGDLRKVLVSFLGRVICGPSRGGVGRGSVGVRRMASYAGDAWWTGRTGTSRGAIGGGATVPGIGALGAAGAPPRRRWINRRAQERAMR